MKIMDNRDLHGKKIFNQLPDTIPNELLNREWALKIHNQTLERLEERGGLSILELIMNIKKIPLNDLISKYGYNYKPTDKDANELLELIKQQSKQL